MSGPAAGGRPGASGGRGARRTVIGPVEGRRRPSRQGARKSGTPAPNANERTGGSTRTNYPAAFGRPAHPARWGRGQHNGARGRAARADSWRARAIITPPGRDDQGGGRAKVRPAQLRARAKVRRPRAKVRRTTWAARRTSSPLAARARTCNARAPVTRRSRFKLARPKLIDRSRTRPPDQQLAARPRRAPIKVAPPPARRCARGTRAARAARARPCPRPANAPQSQFNLAPPSPVKACLCLRAYLGAQIVVARIPRQLPIVLGAGARHTCEQQFRARQLDARHWLE